MSNPISTASIAWHPIDPMLIPFSIAFFVSMFVGNFAKTNFKRCMDNRGNLVTRRAIISARNKIATG